jgi:hypothetical protein
MTIRAVRVVTAVALIALAAACGPGNKTIPADPKARGEFMDTTATKLKPDDRALLQRFIERLDTQATATGKPPEVSVTRALDLQRAFELQGRETQRNLQQLQEAAKAVMTVEVSDPKVIRDEKARPSVPALRYVVNVTNHSKRIVESVTVRLEFRDASGKYLAVVPALELAGKLLPGDVGRLGQTLPLNPQRHQYILDGKPMQIAAHTTRIVYAGGEVLEPGKELQSLESLHRTKIE